MPHESASSSTVKAEGKLPYIRPTPRIIGGSLVRAAANRRRRAPLQPSSRRPVAHRARVCRAAGE